MPFLSLRPPSSLEVDRSAPLVVQVRPDAAQIHFLHGEAQRSPANRVEEFSYDAVRACLCGNGCDEDHGMDLGRLITGLWARNQPRGLVPLLRAAYCGANAQRHQRVYFCLRPNGYRKNLYYFRRFIDGRGVRGIAQCVLPTADFNFHLPCCSCWFSQGIVPRAVREVFQFLQERASDYQVTASFLEIYNEVSFHCFLPYRTSYTILPPPQQLEDLFAGLDSGAGGRGGGSGGGGGSTPKSTGTDVVTGGPGGFSRLTAYSSGADSPRYQGKLRLIEDPQLGTFCRGLTEVRGPGSQAS